MNAQRRQAAIEAGARALREDDGHDKWCEREWEPGAMAWTPCGCGRSDRVAAAVIDAAAPHLVPPVIRYAVLDEDDMIVDDARDRSRLWGLSRSGNRVVALVSVEEEPVGNDGLTDAEREEYARQYRAGPGRTDLS